MEYTLWDDDAIDLCDYKSVLILILMEYTLWESVKSIWVQFMYGLNPYSNGIYSVRLSSVTQRFHLLVVLILILMEYTLWEADLFNDDDIFDKS